MACACCQSSTRTRTRCPTTRRATWRWSWRSPCASRATQCGKAREELKTSLFNSAARLIRGLGENRREARQLAVRHVDGAAHPGVEQLLRHFQQAGKLVFPAQEARRSLQQRWLEVHRLTEFGVRVETCFCVRVIEFRP